jgi:hypothetical protein
MPKFYTLRDIAKELRVPFHRVRYAISEGRIKEAARIGIVRVFTSDQLPLIKAALQKSSRRELANA